MERNKKNTLIKLLIACLLALFFIITTSFSISTHSCSTFMLSYNDILLVGHNLDGPRWRWRQEPGSVFINKKNTFKRSVSGYELGASNKQHTIEWISKYGSVTFNYFGRELPDGGMNEVGLVVNEMGYGYKDYTYNDSLPTMMVTQWIQYQLDNFATVEEVIENINSINIVHWGLPAPIGGNNWHFFIADKDANIAIIEFSRGRVKIFTGDSAPIPVLCNNAYQKDIEDIKKYRGFGGKRPILLKLKLLSYWFNQGARMVNEYDPEKDGHPVKYGFDILKTMQRPLCEQWSIIYDVKNFRVGFRTYFASNIRYFDLSSFDFNTNEVKVLPDIHINYSGDIATYFVPYTYQLNCEIVEKSLREFLKAFKKLHSFENTGNTPEKYIEDRKNIVLKIINTKTTGNKTYQ